jgi:glutaredoxin
MSNYYIDAIILNGCPYSMAAKELLEMNKIKTKFTFINQSEKDKYKNDKIKTFPQIYLASNNKDKILFGGFDDLSSLINKFKGKYLKSDVAEYITNNNNVNKKNLLRFIQLINSKYN